MNKLILCAAMSLMTVAGFTSCSDDDDKKLLIPDNSYTETNGLTLTLNGQPAVGKTVKFEHNGSQGTITISSSFNLSDIPFVGALEAAPVLEGPGVLPGSPITVLNVKLTDINGENAKFSGAGESDYCTYEYNGCVTATSIDLNFTNVTLKDLSLVGSYKLLPYNVNEDWDSDEYGTIYSEPIYFKWESSANLSMLGTEFKMADIFRLLMTMPLLNNMTVRVPDMLCTMLQDVTLCSDGNITANYLDLKNESDTPSYLTSPANMAQYVVTGKNTLRFFLNPQAVIKDATRAETPDIDINNILGNVMAQVAPMLKDGVPMNYIVNGNNTSIYLGTETLLPLLKQNVLPLLRDEKLVNMLVELVSQNEDMKELAEMIPDMVKSAADVIEGTTTLEIGLNLTNTSK